MNNGKEMIILMKEVIEKLVEIEKKAHNIIENTKSDKVEIERRKRAELEDLRKKLEEENREKIGMLRKQLEEETLLEIETAHKESNDKLKSMEEAFSGNREGLVNDIFEKIIN